MIMMSKQALRILGQTRQVPEQKVHGVKNEL